MMTDNPVGEPGGEGVTMYTGPEMPLVSRVLMIFQPGGAKLVVEQTAAA